jgi:hypothetical protein
MVRGVRYEVILQCISQRNDFTAVTEMLLVACNKGKIVQEVPTTLSVRKTGYSKMKIWHTIMSHITLIMLNAFGKLQK